MRPPLATVVPTHDLLASPRSRLSARPDSTKAWERLRILFFFAAMAPVWLFPNPSATSFSEDPTAGREGTLFIQLLWFGLLIFGLGVARGRFAAIKAQFDLSLLLLLGWCLLSTAFALVPDVSLRRLIMTVICMTLFILMFAGIRTVRSLLWLLLAMCLIETVTKFVFVFALPQYGKHLATGAEPQLAGLWRGQFAHKNIAGPICAVELIILYAARRTAPLYFLLPLAALELIFLIFSGSKTPLFLIFLMAMFARVILSMRNGPMIAATVLAGLALLNTVTLASVVSDDAKQLAGELIGDVTFTGRVELWRFLLHYAADYPIMGAGFQSFWQVGTLSPAVSRGNSWVVAAVYGHQGFLDTVVMIGVPGLILTLIFLVVRPALDLAHVTRRKDPILEMFVTIWLFGLFENGTESLLLNRADGTWLFLVASVVGIRRYRLKDGIEPQPARRPAGRFGRRFRSGISPVGALAVARPFVRAAGPSR